MEPNSEASHARFRFHAKLVSDAKLKPKVIWRKTEVGENREIPEIKLREFISKKIITKKNIVKKIETTKLNFYFYKLEFLNFHFFSFNFLNFNFPNFKSLKSGF